MRLMHSFVRQHGLADDVADGEDVGHVGTHLNVYVGEDWGLVSERTL